VIFEDLGWGVWVGCAPGVPLGTPRVASAHPPRPLAGASPSPSVGFPTVLRRRCRRPRIRHRQHVRRVPPQLIPSVPPHSNRDRALALDRSVVPRRCRTSTTVAVRRGWFLRRWRPPIYIIYIYSRYLSISVPLSDICLKVGHFFESATLPHTQGWAGRAPCAWHGVRPPRRCMVRAPTTVASIEIQVAHLVPATLRAPTTLCLD